MLKFRNQYLITNIPNAGMVQGYSTSNLFNLDLNIFESLEINVSEHQSRTVVLIGIAIDPHNPTHSHTNITEHIVQNSPDLTSFFKHINRLTGRFVALFENSNELVLVGDLSNFRQIFYSLNSDQVIITSSPKLFLDFFNLKLKSNPLKTEFVNSETFSRKDKLWYGDNSPDDRLNKLLPHHYLDIKRKKIERIPLEPNYYSMNRSYDEIIGKSSKILRGTYDALFNRDYKLLQPLTSGWDSRLLLAASKNYLDSIYYYVFHRDDHDIQSNHDVRIPLNLTNKLNIEFDIVIPDKLSDEFIEFYKDHHIYPRILPKTRNIQHHLNTHKESNQKVINLNGNTAEIVRSAFGYYKGTPPLKMFFYISGYHTSKFIRNEITGWYYDAVKYSEHTGIHLLDLFYLEQYMPYLGAQFPYEQDIAIEEISLFNNRELISILYSSGFAQRKRPQQRMYKKLIGHLWEETLSEPFNPGDSKIKALIKRNTTVYYYSLLFGNQFV